MNKGVMDESVMDEGVIDESVVGKNVMGEGVMGESVIDKMTEITEEDDLAEVVNMGEGTVPELLLIKNKQGLIAVIKVVDLISNNIIIIKKKLIYNDD